MAKNPECRTCCRSPIKQTLLVLAGIALIAAVIAIVLGLV